MIAAAARCALPPFSGWLLSSMTAPTPVSALMHAGLVNAGGFLLLRFAPALEAAPLARIAAMALGLLAALYGMVNVPQCVWIDEAGQIVRPPEVAGSTDHFRRMDAATRSLTPEDMAARLAAREAYMLAVRDWVRTGRHALDAETVQAKLPRITPEMALADANFRLGIWLRRHGREADAAGFLAEASRLHPASWNIFRQAAQKNETGLAAGPEFWERVQALGDRPYYEPPDLLEP